MDDRTAEQVARAQRAKLILEDPLVVAALGDIKTQLREAWEASPARDKEGREELYRFMRVASKFEMALRAHIETGEIATHQLRAEEEQQTLMERLRDKLPF